MTLSKKLEKIWEAQKPDEYGHRHPIQYERCLVGWRLYFWSAAGGGDAIVKEGSPSLREAIDAAYTKLFPKESKGDTHA